MGRVLSVNISKEKGTGKIPIEKAVFKVDCGIENDAHSGNWHRQISLLADESIDKIRKHGFENLRYGDFAENVTTEDIELFSIPIGSLLAIGDAVIEVTQIGKQCHSECEIYRKIGTCVMPLEGIFGKVRKEGEVKAGDKVEVIKRPRVGCIVSSDKAYQHLREDGVLPVFEAELNDYADVVVTAVLPDEKDALSKEIKRMADEEAVDIIFTSGGTGLSPRDVTPEATKDVIEREAPGIAEGIRAMSLQYTNTAILSRGIAGTYRKTLIINLPGSPKAVRQCIGYLIPVLEHMVENVRGTQYECGK